MKMSSLALILLAISSVVVGQIPSLGFCPDYVPISDFDVNKFLGKWYEVERYFAVSEVGTRCISTEYTKGPSGKIYVSNEITNRLTGVKRVVDGVLDLVGKVGEGSMIIKYNSFPSYDTAHKILDTDYTSYAVLWSCSGIGPVNTQNAWVYTRDRTPSQATLQRVYGVLDKFKISRTYFLKTDQKDCALGGAVEESAATSTSKPDDSVAAKELEPEPNPVVEHILKIAEKKETKDTKYEDPKPEEPTQEDPTQEDPTHEEPTHEDPTHEEPTHEEPTHEEPTHEDPTHEEPTHEEPTHEDPTHEEPTHEDPTHEEPTNEDPTREEPTREEPTREDPTREEPTRQEPTQEEPIHEDPTHEDPKVEEPKYEDPLPDSNQEDPKYIDPKEEETKIEETKFEDPKYEQPRYDDVVEEIPVKVIADPKPQEIQHEIINEALEVVKEEKLDKNVINTS